MAYAKGHGGRGDPTSGQRALGSGSGNPNPKASHSREKIYVVDHVVVDWGVGTS